MNAQIKTFIEGEPGYRVSGLTGYDDHTMVFKDRNCISFPDDKIAKIDPFTGDILKVILKDHTVIIFNKDYFQVII